MMSRALNPAQAVPDAVGVPDAQAAPSARPAPATRPGRGPGPAAALAALAGSVPVLAAVVAVHSARAALRLAGATRARVLRLAGPEAGLVAALGTGLAAVVTAVTVAAVRSGLGGVAPVARVTVPWTPLAAIALVCLVAAVLGSVLTAAAALRDPGQSLAAAAAG
jgi:putative ABC transport system permease protein